MTDHKKDTKQNNSQEQDTTVKPDSETLKKTDPQDNMKGPISSVMQKTKDAFESDESQTEAEDKKEKEI